MHDPVKSEVDVSVQFVKGVGPRLAGVLGERLDIHSIEDLLRHFPTRYEDRRNFRPLAQLRPGEPVVASGRISQVIGEKSRRRGISLTRVLLKDSSGQAELVFFNQYWLEAVFRRLQGKEISIYGIPQWGDRSVVFQHPEWEELGEEDGSLHVRRIVPIHPATEGVTPRQIRTLIANALARYAGAVPEAIPDSVRAHHKLGGLEWSLQQVHFPDSSDALDAARRRLVFEEFLVMQAALAVRRQHIAAAIPGIAFPLQDRDLAEFLATLPFALTAAQERAIAEIRADMARSTPMQRLLQGDVGSGKTVVAAAAMITAIRAGAQCAIMVPTEILAEQHYAVFRRLLEPLGIRVHRLVGSVRARGKKLIKEDLKTGLAHAVVGTHALIEEDVEFRNLGLVVIDEQHRFGVLQRMRLLDKSVGGALPDMLVMSATPIPRSLALTVYGDLELTVIDQMPPGRKAVVTHWKTKSQRDSVYRGVRKLVSQGRQVYYVCPLVEASEKLQAKAATEVFEHLRGEVFPDLRVGLIHGQMPSHEKDEAMDRFRSGEYDILVATVVIEVGVDVANASCMVIEDAERFGLAQLHQLRGRVGRGEHQSFCVLLADPGTPEGEARLDILARTSSGFEIAEEDLRLRGPGEFAGTRQSGILRLRIASITGDSEILREAREAARQIVEADRQLQHPEHAGLARAVRRMYSDVTFAAVG